MLVKDQAKSTTPSPADSAYMNEETQANIDKANRSIERLCKWRTIFAGWQLGTRADTDAECQAVRNTAEQMLMYRAELSTLTRLLIAKGILTKEEFTITLGDEAEILMLRLEKQFPGFSATDLGMRVDPQIAIQTTKHWKA